MKLQAVIKGRYEAYRPQLRKCHVYLCEAAQLFYIVLKNLVLIVKNIAEGIYNDQIRLRTGPWLLPVTS